MPLGVADVRSPGLTPPSAPAKPDVKLLRPPPAPRSRQDDRADVGRRELALALERGQDASEFSWTQSWPRPA